MTREFQPHSRKQYELLFSRKRISIAGTGIQWGKSIVGVVWLKILMHQHSDPTCNFLVTSPTYKILYQSTLPVFLSINGDIGTYDKKAETFRIHGGGTVYFRTGTDPDSVVGITNVYAILCDEAGKYSRYFWDNVQARSSLKEAPIMIVTSPYSLNWLYTDFIRKYANNDQYVRELCHIVQANSAENPYFPMKEYVDRQNTMDIRRFNMIYGGQFHKAEGLVYDVFNQDTDVIDPISLPSSTRYFAGVDWGYTDPFVVTVRAVTESGMHYRVGEIYKPNQRLQEMVDQASRLKGLFNIEKFYADPSRPEYIAEFCRNGLRCIPANNEILPGIEKHYELIKDHRFKIFKDVCIHTVDELETYHYPEEIELKPDQNNKNKNLPVDQSNHTMDADRYCTMGTFTIGKKKSKIVVSKSNEKLHEESPLIVEYKDPKYAPPIDLKIKKTKWEKM